MHKRRMQTCHYRDDLLQAFFAETINFFKGCTIQSTINDSVYYEYDEQVDKINDSTE